MSAPYCSTSSSGSTTLPRCLLILRPSAITISWKRQPLKGSPCSRNEKRADVAQRLGDDALVEDEAAAVGAGDEALRGQPALQVGVGEHLLGTGLGWHRGGHPEPERVEVAVEGVGLALGRLAAARAGDVDELGALGQRVALARRLDVARQHHRQVLARAPAPARSLAVDDRDRRSPEALAGDREVGGAVARSSLAPRRPGSASGCWPAPTSATARPTRRERRVGLVDRWDPQRGGRPVAGVDERRDEDRQRLRRSRAPSPRRRCRPAAPTWRRGRCAPSRPSAARRAAWRPGVSRPAPRASGWRGESRTKRRLPRPSRGGA